MSDIDDFNNFYNEWDECDAPGIIYNDETVETNIKSNENDKVETLSDSFNFDDDTVEFNLINSEPSTIPRLNNETLPSKVVTQEPDAVHSSSNEDKNTHRILSQIASRKNKPQEDSQSQKRKLKETKKNDLLMEKKIKLALSAKQRSMKPDEVIKRITVHIDTNIVNCSHGSLIIPALQKEDIKYKVNFLKYENTITWTKTLTEPYIDDEENICTRETELTENIILSIMPWKMLINLIANNLLIEHIKNLKSDKNKRLTIIIIELDKYLHHQTKNINRALKSLMSGSQQQKTKKSEKEMEDAPKLSREEIEIALTQAQLLTNTCHRKFENGEDLANFVFQMSRSISQIESKRERNEKDQQTLSWFAKGDSKAGVSVDKNGNGLQQLWQQQLCQFNNVGLEVAQAILLHYKSPQSLLLAYKKCTDVKSAEELLSNVTIRREAGILSSSRRVGSERSKKIYRFFTSTSPLNIF